MLLCESIMEILGCIVTPGIASMCCRYVVTQYKDHMLKKVMG